MKKLIITIAFIVTLSIVQSVFAQPPAPPPPSEHGSSNNNPSGAPIGEGLGIFLILASFYSGIKIYKSVLLKKDVQA
jgi:hypothetical protein